MKRKKREREPINIMKGDLSLVEWWCCCCHVFKGDVVFMVVLLCAMDGLNVGSLDKVEAREDTSTGNTTQNVGAITLEEGGDALILQDLSTSIKCRFVVDASSRGHHHATADGVNGV